MLKYVAGIAGVITIAATLVMYIITGFPQARKILRWHDSLHVISFVSSSHLVVSNTGDGSIFIKNIKIIQSVPDNEWVAAIIIPVQEELAAGKILNHKFEANDKGRWAVAVHSKGGPTTDRWKKTEERVINPEDNCYFLGFTDSSDEGFLQVREHYQSGADEVMTLPYTAEIYFYSPHQNIIHRTPFEIVATVYKRVNPECR